MYPVRICHLLQLYANSQKLHKNCNFIIKANVLPPPLLHSIPLWMDQMLLPFYKLLHWYVTQTDVSLLELPLQTTGTTVCSKIANLWLFCYRRHVSSFTIQTYSTDTAMRLHRVINLLYLYKQPYS